MRGRCPRGDAKQTGGGVGCGSTGPGGAHRARPPAGRPAAPRSTTDNGAALLCCRSNHHAAHASLSLGLHLCLCVQPRPFRRPCVRLLRVAWHPSRGLRSLAAGQSSGWVSRRLVSLELEVSYRLPFRINKQEMDHGWMDGYGVHVLGG